MGHPTVADGGQGLQTEEHGPNHVVRAQVQHRVGLLHIQHSEDQIQQHHGGKSQAKKAGQDRETARW